MISDCVVLAGKRNKSNNNYVEKYAMPEKDVSLVEKVNVTQLWAV